MKNYILILPLILLTTSCTDKMFSKTKEVVKTPSLSTPTTSPHDFAGVKNVTNVTATTATVEWDDVTNAATYTVFIATPTSGPVVKEIVKAPSSSVVIKGLAPNTSYEVFVRMMDTGSLIDAQMVPIQFTTTDVSPFTNTTSLQFRGNESIKLKNSFEMFSHPQKFAISLWFKSNIAFKEDVRLVSLHRSFGPSENLSVGIDGGKLFLTYINSSGETKKTITTENVVKGNWHNVILNVNVDKIDLYLDNVKVLARVDILSSFGHHNTFLGAMTGYQKGFEGLMDEVSFWNAPLTLSDISQIFNKSSQLTSIEEGPALWLRMGDDKEDGPSALVDQVSGVKFQAYGLSSSDFLNDAP